MRAIGSLALIAAGVALLVLVWAGSGGADDEAGCPDGWLSFDDSVRHYRACLPGTLLYYNGGTATPLAEVDQNDPDFEGVILLANQGWIDTWPEDFPSDPLVAPLSLRIQLADDSTTIDGCDPRDVNSEERTLRTCEERFGFNFFQQPIPSEDGFIHIYKALVPTDHVPEGESGVWDIYLLVDSPSAVWAGQEAVVNQIVQSIETY